MTMWPLWTQQKQWLKFTQPKKHTLRPSSRFDGIMKNLRDESGEKRKCFLTIIIFPVKTALWRHWSMWRRLEVVVTHVCAVVCLVAVTVESGQPQSREEVGTCSLPVIGLWLQKCCLQFLLLPSRVTNITISPKIYHDLPRFTLISGCISHLPGQEHFAACFVRKWPIKGLTGPF